MTLQQARQILLNYRPWAPEALEPEMAEALALCRANVELARWFDGHCALQNAIRAQFGKVPLPAGLKEQIISEYKPHLEITWWRRPALQATAAGAMLFIAIVSIWLNFPRQTREDTSFAAYRSRMVHTAARAYGMDLETNDVGQIRAYLGQHQTPADYVLPSKLDPAAIVGCAVLSWQGRPVTMLCYRTGRPLAPGSKSDLYLFVIEQKDVENPPDTNTPGFAPVGTFATASWSEGGKVYVLAAPDQSDLNSRL
jgi:hypothetical protein